MQLKHLNVFNKYNHLNYEVIEKIQVATIIIKNQESNTNVSKAYSMIKIFELNVKI